MCLFNPQPWTKTKWKLKSCRKVRWKTWGRNGTQQLWWVDGTWTCRVVPQSRCAESDLHRAEPSDGKGPSHVDFWFMGMWKCCVTQECFPGLCAYLYLSSWRLPLCWRALMWECAFRGTLRWRCHPDETNQSNRHSDRPCHSNRPMVGTSPRHSQSESFLGMSQTGVWREMSFSSGGISGKVGGKVKN